MNPDSLPAQIRIEFVVTSAGRNAYVAHPTGVKAPSTDRGKSLDPNSMTAEPSTIILLRIRIGQWRFVGWPQDV